MAMFKSCGLVGRLAYLRIKGCKSRQFGVLATSGAGDSVLLMRDYVMHWGSTPFSTGYKGSKDDYQQRGRLLIPGSVAVALGAIGLLYYKKFSSRCSEVVEEDTTAPSARHRSDLPDFQRVDIRKRSNKESGVWVTYQNGVYDISEFVEKHPGGDRILLAAGGPLEPFWNMYDIHKTPSVTQMLESLRIGNIDPADSKEENPVAEIEDPYANDPERHPALKVIYSKPFNAETPPELLVDCFTTANTFFFVRNHFHTPRIQEKDFALLVEGTGMRDAVSFSLEDLKETFQENTIIAAVQCTGNRRADMDKAKKLPVTTCDNGLIGNAEWTGVKLTDLLNLVGANEDDVRHVIFQGSDSGADGIPYEVSIPAEYAFDPRKDVLLAYKMNGDELPVDHGYPLRVIVPGIIGARHVKWVTKIILSEHESQEQWQMRDYKIFPEWTTNDCVDFSKLEAVQEYPVQSSICEPREGSVVEAGDDLLIRGYAWSGGGRGILRVDVSINGGKTWQETQLRSANQRRNREWSWTLFETTIPVPDMKGDLTIICKALDSSYNVQPENPLTIWNASGYLHNAWHYVNIKVK